jgi:hypothetical protein
MARVRQQVRSRAFVKKSALLDPASEITPLIRLLEQGDDMAYIRYFSLDRTNFDELHGLFAAKEAQRMAAKRKSKAGRRPCLDSRGRLAFCLYYLVSPCQQQDMFLTFGLPPATMSRTLWTSLRVLDRFLNPTRACVLSRAHPSCSVLCQHPDAAIQWPSPEQIKYYNRMMAAREPVAAAYGAWATVDGLNLDVEEPFGCQIKYDLLVIILSHLAGKTVCTMAGFVL